MIATIKDEYVDKGIHGYVDAQLDSHKANLSGTISL